MKKIMLFASTLLLLVAFGASAQSAEDTRPPAAPNEAIDACGDRAVDEECTFENSRGDIFEGTCKAVSNNERLKCVISDEPGNRKGR
jgi:hypothetical protein